MTKAAYEIMQNFNAVLADYNEHCFEEWKKEHGLAAHYAYDEKKAMPAEYEIVHHVEGEYGEDLYELVDGSCLYIGQPGYRWARDVINNLKDRKKVRFERANSMNADEMMKFAFTSKSGK